MVRTSKSVHIEFKLEGCFLNNNLIGSLLKELTGSLVFVTNG
jgi:hypothetical protein